MTFKQLTVLTGNSVSHLNAVMSFLGGQGINIRAHCLVDNGDGFCKLRVVVSEPDKAVEILQAKKITAVVNDVVLVETDDKPGGLSRLLKMLENDDIRIEYSYTAVSETPGIAVMVFRFSNNLKAVKILAVNGLKLIKSNG
jgi:hypothetical protein